MAPISKLVAMGRWINGCEIFIALGFPQTYTGTFTSRLQSEKPGATSGEDRAAAIRDFRLPAARAMYVYTTGVRYRVMICETARPPSTVNPRGRRASPPVPTP